VGAGVRPHSGKRSTEDSPQNGVTRRISAQEPLALRITPRRRPWACDTLVGSFADDAILIDHGQTIRGATETFERCDNVATACQYTTELIDVQRTGPTSLAFTSMATFQVDVWT